MDRSCGRAGDVDETDGEGGGSEDEADDDGETAQASLRALHVT
jgi:hypothetical protein